MPVSPAPALTRWLPLALLALLQIGYQGSFVLKGDEYIASHLTVDDTYYYLQTAWNTSRLGFVTFDGLHRTNGVQFFWFWMLVLLAKLLPGKIVFFHGAMFACVALNALAYTAIGWLGPLWNRQA